MRNLKRALSLTLASVMLLGMMVVGSSAAAGYDDVKETDNVEAIEVLQAVEVMVGDDRGFGPDRPVNRAEMAVVMGKLLNLDYNYYVSTCPFTDVSGNYDWAKGWVGACAANGIVSGRGNGVYDPGATVTAVEAASMMMRALGYFQYTEDYADGFNVVTVRQGSQIGIFNGVGTDANTPMTRNQVAQMALNALESEMVTFTGTPGVSVNGVNVGYRAEYTPRTSTQTKYQAIERRTSDVSGGNNLNRGQYYIQLGEELYNGKLTKRYARDDFERPSINWQYDGKDIGTYVDYDLLVANGSYTDGVKFSELYDLLTYTTINENDVLRYEDGVNLTVDKKDFNRSNKTEVGGTGALTEVFLDLERDEIIITTINTYLAKANSDYNSTNESLSLKVFAENEKGITKIVDSREVPEAENVAKDEYKLVYMSGKDSAAAFEGYVRYDVVNIFDIEIMDGAEITKWSKDAPKVVGKLTTGGTEYSSNRKAYYDYGNVLDDYDLQLLSDMSYNIYMDRYGNVIGVDLHEGAKNYVFITGYDRGRSNISVKTAEAAAIFTDGTMDTITVNVTDTNKNIRSAVNSTKEPGAYGEYDEWVLTGNNLPTGGDRNLNRWYTYTQSANGNYTLKPVKNFIFTAYKDTAFDSNGVKILDCANLFLDDSSKLTSKGRVYGEDASIYLAVDTGEVDYSGANTPGGISNVNDAITDVEGVYTGAQDIKIELTNDVKDGGSKGKVNNDKTKDNPPVAQESLAEQDAYVYTIFDNDNYIIASVVMGDAQGAAANYVYVLDGAKNERVERAGSSRDASSDTYYWEFDAVVNGEKQTLTVKEKYSTTLAETLNVHGIVEIRYDGEYVVDIKNVDDSDIFYYWTENGKLVQSREIEDNEVYDVGNQWNGAYGDWAKSSTDWRGVGNVHNTRLMDKNTNASNRYAYNYDKIDRVEGTIYLQGRTLYVDNKYTSDRDVGLGLVRDAKAVLVQPENGKIEVTSCATVQEAIDRLSDRVPETTEPGIQFKGRIAGVLDGRGVAEWVVIISDTNLVTGNTPDYGIDSILEWSYELHEWILNIPSSELEEWEKNGTAVVYSWLVKAGCSDVEKTTKGWDFTFKGVYNKDQIVNINWVYDDEVIRSVNPVLPTETTLEDGATLPTAKAETGAHYSVSISWTKDGKAYNDTKVNGAGTYAWTVTLTADKGYTFASGVKTVYTGSIVVKETGLPEGTEVTVTVNANGGTATAGTDFEVTGLGADGKIKVGESFTIKALRQIYVYQGNVRSEVAAGTVVTVSPTDNLAVYINMFGFTVVDGALAMGEVTDANTPTAAAPAAVAGMMRYARIAPDYVNLYFTTANGKTETFTVQVPNTEAAATGPWKFSKYVDAAKLLALVNQLNADVKAGKMPVPATSPASQSDIDKWTNGEPTEPTELDAEKLQVQVALATGTPNTVTGFSVYFGNKTERTLTAKEIADAITAAGIETEESGVDIANHKATAKYGEKIEWTNTVLAEDGVAKNPGAAPLYKVDFLGDVRYLTAAGKTYTVDDPTLYNVLVLDKGWRASGANAPDVVVPVSGGAVATGGLAEDTTFVKAFSLAFTGLDTAGAGWVYQATTPAGSDVYYDVYITAPGSEGESLMGGQASAAAFIAEGAKITLVPRGSSTHNLTVGQTITVKVNDKAVVSAEVEEANKAPAIDSFVISEGIKTNDPTTNGKNVTIALEISAAPEEPENEQVVYFNGKPATDNGDGTWTLNGVLHDHTVVVEDAEKNLAIPTVPVSKTSSLESTQNKLKTAKYTWSDADVMKQVSSYEGPDCVYLWSAWTVDMTTGSPSWTASTALAAGTTVPDATKNLTGASNYFKTEVPTEIYITTANDGEQLWFPDTKSVKGLELLSEGGLKTDAKRVWSIAVDRNIDGNTLKVAYQVTATAPTAIASGINAAAFGATPIKIAFTVGNALDPYVVTHINQTILTSKTSMTTGEAVDHELTWKDGELYIERVTPGTNNQAPTDLRVEITLVGDYKFFVDIKNA